MKGGAPAPTRSIGDARENASGRVGDLLLDDEPFDQPAEAVGTAAAEATGEVKRRVEGHARDHRSVDVLEPRLILGIVRGERGERSEVAAGGAARDHDGAGVSAVLHDVLAHPAQRALHVDEVVRKGHPRAESVVRRDADPSVGRKVMHEGTPLLALVADHPTAAVDLQQNGRHLASPSPGGRRRAGAGAPRRPRSAGCEPPRCAGPVAAGRARGVQPTAPALPSHRRRRRASRRSPPPVPTRACARRRRNSEPPGVR